MLTYSARKLDICQNCGNKFNIGERIPRIMVNCGHTFCTKCLETLNTNARIRCVICSKLIKNIDTVEKLPLNINILHEIVDQDPILSKVSFESEEDSSQLCPKHTDRTSHFFCSVHRTIFCRECIKTDHYEPSCFVVDLYEIQKMKNIYVQNVECNLAQIKKALGKDRKGSSDK